MRYIIIHDTNAHWESGAIPDRPLIDRVEALLGEMSAAGVLLAGEGLAPSSEGVRLQFAQGRRTIIPGPFSGATELPAGFTIVRVGSLDEAIEWATREARILGSAEIDIRPVHEAWDVGMAPPPAEIGPRRYMILHKATPATEAANEVAPALREQLSRLIDEGVRRGVHLTTESMRPSRTGRRCTNTSQGKTFYDGPFLESKELLGGYVIVTASSLDEACLWVPRYMDAIGAESVSVRELQ
jgi:hypothetical protein